MSEPKPLELVTVEPPPPEQRVRRDARFALPGEKRTRYSLPTALESGSPIGYRTRMSMTQDEGRAALRLLSLRAPTGFGPAEPIPEGELFMMGDNTKNSNDSRGWGSVPEKDLIGSPFVVLYPFQRFKILR